MKTKTFWTTPLIVATLLLASFTILKPKNKMKKTFVLVHGAYAGKFAWAKVTPLLEKDGNKVIAMDLPAHGDDQTPISQATMDSYVAQVVGLVNKEPGKVVLVGHSMGGMVISQVAEAIPNKLDKLVYLSAFLPVNGQSIFTTPDPQSLLIGPNLIFSEDKASATLKPEFIVPIFGAGCPPDIQKLVVDRHRPEPLQPFGAKAVVTDANFGRVPKYFIETLQDRGIGPLAQEKMIKANGKVIKTFKLDCGHSPYFAKPTELAAILNGL